MELDGSRDYPLGTRRPDLVATPAGRSLGELTLDALRSGELDGEDLRATPETLRLQAAVARDAGRPELAANLERAAELAGVPSETLLELYTALRPRRSTAAALEAWAARLEADHAAPLTAAFVREALAVYAERGLLALSDERAPAV
ncbi:MAG TPA: diol dehydratase small subunit [Gaiellaceae bacterium]|nr:diol dehydratase small subunit [Gaiellaceae bacterium]